MPKRVQMSRQHPWRADNPDAVIVARPSKWGNPYRFDDLIINDDNPYSKDRDGGAPALYVDADLAVALYRRMITSAGHARWLLLDLDELTGKDLACWCALDQPCHADVLLELANKH